ncbi:hypothetical protein LEQ41_05070 [Streptococcus agalactiae]|nr:hypothetical protein [Streptococcus agalactiae]
MLNSLISYFPSSTLYHVFIIFSLARKHLFMIKYLYENKYSTRSGCR